MYRDFSESSKDELCRSIREIGSCSEQCGNYGIDSLRRDHAEWIGKLGLGLYFDHVTAFENTISETCDMCRTGVNNIFSFAWSLDESYGNIFADVLAQLDNWKEYIKTLSGYVNGGSGVFIPGNISSGLKDLATSISDQEVKCLEGLIVRKTDGKTVYNIDITGALLKRAATDVSEEQKRAVIEVLLTLASNHGRDGILQAGDIISSSGLQDALMEWNSNVLAQSYSDGVYIELIKQLLENGKNKDSFAAAILSFTCSDADMELFGIDAYGELKKLAGIIPVGSAAGLESYLVSLTTDHGQIRAGDVNTKIEAGINTHAKSGSYTIVPAIYAECSAEGSLAEAAWAGTEGLLAGNVSAKIGNAYADAQLTAGVFTYENGKGQMSSCIDAQFGAGVSALDMSASGTVGNDHIGLYGTADVDVLEAEAKAQAGAGLFDNEGQIKPQAYFDVSAQANLASVSGTMGVTILGADIGVKGGLTVGVGGHISGGYKDGHLKMDVGASLGVGVTAGFDIDVDGLVKGVSALISDAWSGISSAIADGWNDFCSAWDSFWSWAL